MQATRFRVASVFVGMFALSSGDGQPAAAERPDGPLRWPPAQGRTIGINGVPSCPSCGIELETVVRLGGNPRAPHLLHHGPAVAVDSRGRWLALSWDRQKVLVHDPNGRLVVAFGQDGQGPAEFPTRPYMLAPVTSDSLYVFAEPRLLVLSPTHQFVRSVTVLELRTMGGPA